jgi:hypothetical protein
MIANFNRDARASREQLLAERAEAAARQEARHREREFGQVGLTGEAQIVELPIKSEPAIYETQRVAESAEQLTA